MTYMHIEILCTDPAHPVVAHLERWLTSLPEGTSARLVTRAAELGEGEFLFLIACQEIVECAVRERFRHALVIHESDLPKGRGWSPLIWQILAGTNRIPVTLLEAANKVDSGRIWHQLTVDLEGTELAREIHDRVSKAKLALMEWAVQNRDTVAPREQIGEATYYPRRTPADSEIDPQSTFAEAFDLLRVADEDRYPAFLRFRGKRFRIRIDEI
ncbi:MAG TPA: formyltransferase family protein [Allosphingosinicella sp.]|nr:formyltransferase family protein [Allosphingosinicella sp.]